MYLNIKFITVRKKREFSVLAGKYNCLQSDGKTLYYTVLN